MSNPYVDTLTINSNQMQGRLSAWLAKHKLAHKPLGFDYQGT